MAKKNARGLPNEFGEATPHEQTVLQRQIDATDKQIDGLVYELYGLTDEGPTPSRLLAKALPSPWQSPFPL